MASMPILAMRRNAHPLQALYQIETSIPVPASGLTRDLGIYLHFRFSDALKPRTLKPLNAWVWLLPRCRNCAVFLKLGGNLGRLHGNPLDCNLKRGIECL